MLWLLFILVAAGVVGALVWEYRRKTAQRNAVSRERFERMFQAQTGPARSPGSSGAGVPGPDAAPPTPTPLPPTPASRPSLAAAQRFMGPPDTLVYLLLRTAVPEYEVFARVALSTFVSAEGADAETRRRLSQTPVDFLICDREMRAVVAVELDVAGRAEMSGERRIRAETLQAAGIRLVRLNAAALPRRAEARSLIVGGASAPGPARP